MSAPLKDKVALVTGASRGIGAAIAKRLASDGATVVLTYAGSHSAADGVVREIAAGGGKARAIQANALVPGTGATVVEDVMRTEGALDILVNNAGVNIMKPLEAIEDEDFETVFGVNVRGTLDVVRASARRMGEGGRIIVVTATIANDYFAPSLGLYGASKAAANAFVQGWCRDLGPKGITINAVVPGPINTDMNPESSELGQRLHEMVPLGRHGTPEEVASLAAFLAGPDSSFITGSLMIVDGGMSV